MCLCLYVCTCLSVHVSCLRACAVLIAGLRCHFFICADSVNLCLRKAVFVAGIEKGNASMISVLEMAMLAIRSSYTSTEALFNCKWATQHTK